MMCVAEMCPTTLQGSRARFEWPGVSSTEIATQTLDNCHVTKSPSNTNAREQTSGKHAFKTECEVINTTDERTHTVTRDPLNTNTDAVIDTESDENMIIPDDTQIKAKRNYFAIYHDEALLEAVENARGTESANAFLTRLICNALNVDVPARKTRRRFVDKETATQTHEMERAANAEATRILAQREEYAALLASAMRELQS